MEKSSERGIRIAIVSTIAAPAPQFASLLLRVFQALSPNKELVWSTYDAFSIYLKAQDQLMLKNVKYTKKEACSSLMAFIELFATKLHSEDDYEQKFIRKFLDSVPEENNILIFNILTEDTVDDLLDDGFHVIRLEWADLGRATKQWQMYLDEAYFNPEKKTDFFSLESYPGPTLSDMDVCHSIAQKCNAETHPSDKIRDYEHLTRTVLHIAESHLHYP